jgi:hypothetical protein
MKRAINTKNLPREEVRQVFRNKRTTAGRRSAVVQTGCSGRRSELARNPKLCGRRMHRFVEIIYTLFPPN